MKKILYILMIVPLVLGGWIITDRATFDRSAWLADFEQLKSATEQSYANLMWTRESKGVDLVALNDATLQALESANSNNQARKALKAFIAGFKDGHFHPESGPPRPIAELLAVFHRDEVSAIDLDMTGAVACSALGFRRVSHKLAIEGSAMTPASNTTFAAGTITTPSGRSFGVIRIPLFRQYEYGAVCERAWDTFKSARGGSCDEECRDNFEVIAKREVAQALADDARMLARDAKDGIIIDLTGNGGGTEWAEYAAAALTSKPLQPPRVAFIRHPHWGQRFDSEVKWLQSELAKAPAPDRRAVIEQWLAHNTALRDSAAVRCDVSAIWSDRTAQPACWNVVTPPASEADDEVRARAPYEGPLFILTDRHTASASEQFAATLVDNGVAKTIGEPTMGVGCGFTNDGNPITLENSKLVIWMPDCARLRGDGSNEFEGVKPDYPIEWGEKRLPALLTVLDKVR